jgi:hypothetical protein
MIIGCDLHHATSRSGAGPPFHRTTNEVAPSLRLGSGQALALFARVGMSKACTLSTSVSHLTLLSSPSTSLRAGSTGLGSRFSAYPGLTSGANVCRRYSDWSAVDSVCASPRRVRDARYVRLGRGTDGRQRATSAGSAHAVTLLVSSQIARSTLCLWQRCLRRK